jgi:putative ABC transport system substrate-binding protein
MSTRRHFISLLGGAAAAWPVAASGQQPAVPVVGFLDSRSPDALTERLRGFRQGLKEIGYVEGDNATILYRWAENRLDRIPALAIELARRPVAVIVASGGTPVALRAKDTVTTIPIVFIAAEDPVKLGLVASLARPGGNLTGVNFFSAELVAKRLELLRTLVPAATRLAVLVNPANVSSTASTLRDLAPAARTMGLQIQTLNASSNREIDAAFATIVSAQLEMLFVGNDPFLDSRRVQLVQLANRHLVPATYSGREYAEVGGLMSYGSDITDAYRQLGTYAGRILKGVRPSDLPVVQATKFELVINAQTARMLSISVPPHLLAIADEVIE